MPPYQHRDPYAHLGFCTADSGIVSVAKGSWECRLALIMRIMPLCRDKFSQPFAKQHYGQSYITVCLAEKMDGWMSDDEWMDRWMDEWDDAWMDGSFTYLVDPVVTSRLAVF